jgi:lipid-binding SYLF domain-containing protein
MRPYSVLAASFATAFALASTAVLAEADKPAHQAKIKAATQTSLQKFYKAQPRIKGEVEGAPGYAIFTTYGASFGFGGSGGGGVAYDKLANKDTFMRMAQASAGLQVGLAQKDLLIVFKSQKAMQDFVDKGWDFGGEGNISAGVAGHTAGGGAGVKEINDATTYTLTKNGLDVGAGLAGTKFWKDKELN